jgi:nicotinate phosphoribosyltransferase
MIINSLLDTDLYKLTMMQTVLHHFPGAQVAYRFKCRNPGVDLTPYVEAIRAEVGQLCTLRFTDEELGYLRNLRFVKSDFVDFLGLFKLNAKYVSVAPAEDRPGEIDLTISGPWLHTILFEVPVLAIVNEIYFATNQPQPDFAEGRRRLQAKIAELRNAPKGFTFVDFGTRRRFSRVWHAEVIATVKRAVPEILVGSSNVDLARRENLIPIGTMAHEYLQACQALGPRLRDSQVFAFEKWAAEYRGDLGIALSDTVGFDAFLRDFDMYFCKLFDGVRHDSGDPFEWGERMISHYEKLRVDSRSKTLVFSDQLTIPRAFELYRRFKDRAKPAFGIGTNLTNDLGYEALQIVIKMVECNGQPVAKLSDSPEKTMGSEERYMDYLRYVFRDTAAV